MLLSNPCMGAFLMTKLCALLTAEGSHWLCPDSCQICIIKSLPKFCPSHQLVQSLSKVCHHTDFLQILSSLTSSLTHSSHVQSLSEFCLAAGFPGGGQKMSAPDFVQNLSCGLRWNGRTRIRQKLDSARTISGYSLDMRTIIGQNLDDSGHLLVKF